MTCGQGQCTPDAKRVWCTNCQHEHISTIPAFTWACRLCGFGAWHLETALNHTASLPWHETYLVAHPIVPLAIANGSNANADVRPAVRVRDADESAFFVPATWRLGGGASRG